MEMEGKRPLCTQRTIRERRPLPRCNVETMGSKAGVVACRAIIPAAFFVKHSRHLRRSKMCIEQSRRNETHAMGRRFFDARPCTTSTPRTSSSSSCVTNDEAGEEIDDGVSTESRFNKSNMLENPDLQRKKWPERQEETAEVTLEQLRVAKWTCT